MFRTDFLAAPLLCLLVAAGAGLTLPGPVAGGEPSAATLALFQDDEEPPVEDEREAVEALIEKLEPLLKDRKGVRDQEAIGLLDELLSEFERSGPKDRKDICDVVADCLTVKRKELEDGTPNQALQRAAATALGRMGPESEKALLKNIDSKDLRDAHVAHAALLRSVGRLQLEKGIKPMMGLLEGGVYQVEAAAAQALGMYVDAEGETRKDIFARLLKVIMPLEQVIEGGEQGTSDYDEIRKRYDTISSSIRESMQALSGHEERDFNEWQRWWNDNKKADWDEGR